MEGLSQEQVDAFKQEIEDTQVNTQPLISDSFPFETLMIEFEAGNPNFLEKLRVPYRFDHPQHVLICV